MIKRALIFSLLFTFVIAISVFFIFDSLAVRGIAKRFIITQAYYNLNLKVDVKDVRLSYFRPAVIIDELRLEKEDEDTKINLFAPKAVVRFNLVQLLRGVIGVSALKLQSPSLYVETKSDGKPLDLKKINISKVVEKMLGARLDNIDISNANFKLRIDKPDNKVLDISTPKISIELSKGLKYNYYLEVKADNISSPLEYLSGVDLKFDIKKDMIKVEKLIASVVGGKIAVAGYASNISDLSQLRLDLFWRVDFNLDESKKYSNILKFKNEKDYPGGLLSGSGRCSGYLFKDLKSSILDGNVKIRDFSWYSYRVPQIEVTARYGKDQIILSKFEVSDGSKSIEAQDTTISLNAPYAIKGKGVVHDVELSRYLELFNIKHCLSYFTIGGPFSFTGSIKPEIKISGLFDLKVKDFWVLDKKGLAPTKANSILDFKKGSVYGFVHFSAKGAYFDNFVAKSETNTMVVSGWITDEGTMDLDVRSESFSMEPYGRISTLPLKGHGTLSTRLIVDDNGDFKNEGQVSFNDVELLDEYAFGAVNAKVIYDGNKLVLKEIKGKVGSSNYTGYNEIDFDKKPGPTIKGYGAVADGYSEDIYKIFKKQEKFLGAPSGIINATVKFDGYPTWSTIKLDTKIKLKDVELFSERFDELVAGFVWDKGDLSISDLYVTKGRGRLDFKGVRKNNRLKMDVSSKNLSLSDFILLSKRNTELTGGVNIKGEVEHAQKSLAGNVKFNIFDLMIGGQKLKPVNLNLTLGQNVAIKFTIFDQEAKGEITKESKDTYVFRSKFTKFNFYPIGSLFLKDIENFKTDINGDVEIRFTDKFVVRSARIKIDDFSLSNSFVSLKNKGPINVDYLNGAYSIRPFSMLTESDNNKCVLNFDTTQNRDILIKGCATTGMLKLFKGFVTGARGKFDMDLVYDNKLRGTIYPKDVEILTTESKLGGISFGGKINIANSFAKFDELTASVAGAPMSFSGGLDIDNMIKLKSFYPGAKLGLHVDKLYYEYPEGLKGKWTGDVNITGSLPPYRVTGVFSLFEAAYRKDFDLNFLSLNRTKKTRKFFINKKGNNKFDLDVKVKSGGDVIVRNDVFNGELVFDLNIKGTEIEPKLLGSIDLMRGRISYLDNIFELTAGRFKFKEDINEPAVYQLDSEARISGYQVYLKLVSEKGEPKFKLTSSPPLTEDK
ncbi:MAG: translocation/assembly module TamB domain-containing protein, partial [bacterium]